MNSPLKTLLVVASLAAGGVAVAVANKSPCPSDPPDPTLCSKIAGFQCVGHWAIVEGECSASFVRSK